MPYDITLYPDLSLAHFRFFGKMSISDAKQAFLDYVALPGFDPAHVMLSDARNVTGIDATFLGILGNIYGLAAPLRKFDRGALSVVLVSDDVSFGMVRMLEQVLDMTSRIKIRAVWSEAEALSLAGVGGASISGYLQGARISAHAASGGGPIFVNSG